MLKCAYVFTMVYGYDACLSVCVGVSCICANVYVCICHSRGRKNIFLDSKDKNKVLKSVQDEGSASRDMAKPNGF